MNLRHLSTEQPNARTANLDRMSTARLLRAINREDASVHKAVAKAIPEIERAVDAIAVRLKNGGRLFYIGAGTSGRLGCVDASEMPPTYGVSPKLVQGIIAGGYGALRRSVEGAEDDGAAGVRDISKRRIGPRDAVVGLSASGRARYVREGLQEAARRGAFVACITCNRNSQLAALFHAKRQRPAKFAKNTFGKALRSLRSLAPLRERMLFPGAAIIAETGPEAVAGSTRMKAGTAQKLILNMISTAVMVRLGRVKGNRMVDLKIKCEKLRERAMLLVIDETNATPRAALAALDKHSGSVRKAIAALNDER
ncbi:MAG TPA: N-acetylmuramic acid 6-phosphate etherase [Planctomycetota bacterium]|nr:N-acetylmuramic acid 6-phosphate etherase [Planctomycetota bacterium]